MKAKALNILLLFTSLMGYLEWGKDQHQFLFQTEALIFSKLFSDPMSVLHPLILLPFAGQAALLVTLAQEHPGKLLTYFGIASIGILLALMFFIGTITLNAKILASTIPFLAVAFYTIRNIRRAA